MNRQNEKFAQKFPLINPVFRAILTPERKKRSQRALIETKQIKGENINFDSKKQSGKEFLIMSNNRNLVPEAKEALNRFKMEAAAEVGVNLKQGYNGNLTSREAGSVGGQMVKNMTPVRTMKFDRHNRISMGHKITVRYAFSLTV